MLSLNLPNSLTLLRIVVSFIFLVFALQGNWRIAFPLFCAAAFTDLVDGSLARLLRQRTQLGAFLDPLADKLLMFFGFLTLTLNHFLPVALTALIVGRDLMIASGYLWIRSKKIPIFLRPTYLSKLTTLFQIITVCSALVLTQPAYVSSSFGSKAFQFLPTVIGITAVLTVMTTFQYFRIGWRIIHAKT